MRDRGGPVQLAALPPGRHPSAAYLSPGHSGAGTPSSPASLSSPASTFTSPTLVPTTSFRIPPQFDIPEVNRLALLRDFRRILFRRWLCVADFVADADVRGMREVEPLGFVQMFKRFQQEVDKEPFGFCTPDQRPYVLFQCLDGDRDAVLSEADILQAVAEVAPRKDLAATRTAFLLTSAHHRLFLKDQPVDRREFRDGCATYLDLRPADARDFFESIAADGDVCLPAGSLLEHVECEKIPWLPCDADEAAVRLALRRGLQGFEPHSDAPTRQALVDLCERAWPRMEPHLRRHLLQAWHDIGKARDKDPSPEPRGMQWWTKDLRPRVRRCFPTVGDLVVLNRSSFYPAETVLVRYSLQQSNWWADPVCPTVPTSPGPNVPLPLTPDVLLTKPIIAIVPASTLWVGGGGTGFYGLQSNVPVFQTGPASVARVSPSIREGFVRLPAPPEPGVYFVGLFASSNGRWFARVIGKPAICNVSADRQPVADGCPRWDLPAAAAARRGPRPAAPLPDHWHWDLDNPLDAHWMLRIHQMYIGLADEAFTALLQRLAALFQATQPGAVPQPLPPAEAGPPAVVRDVREAACETEPETCLPPPEPPPPPAPAPAGPDRQPVGVADAATLTEAEAAADTSSVPAPEVVELGVGTEAVVMADSVCEPDLALSTDAGCDPILGLGPVAREVSCQGNSIETLQAGCDPIWPAAACDAECQTGVAAVHDVFCEAVVEACEAACGIAEPATREAACGGPLLGSADAGCQAKGPPVQEMGCDAGPLPHSPSLNTEVADAACQAQPVRLAESGCGPGLVEWRDAGFGTPAAELQPVACQTDGDGVSSMRQTERAALPQPASPKRRAVQEFGVQVALEDPAAKKCCPCCPCCCIS